MKTVYGKLANRFRGEIRDLDRTVARASRVWEQANTTSVDQDVYLDSVALNLHGFYSGLEKLFQLVATHLDDDLPTSKNWHHDLLQMMGRDVTNVRPAVIHPDKIDDLDEFRRFRHVVRNVYATNLLPERMSGLLESLPELWTSLKAELLVFAGFLEQLNQADEGN